MRLRLLCTLCIGVSRKFHLHLTLILPKILQNGAKFDFWFQKSQEEFGQHQTSSGKTKKFKFDGLFFFKKQTSLAKTLYTEDLSNITLNYLSKNSPNSICYF